VSKKGKKNGHHTLRGSAEIRRFLRANETPVWFVSRSPLPLLGIDRWVRRFGYVCEVDPFAGRHPGVFAPRPRTSEDLLTRDEVVAHMASRGRGVVITLSGDADGFLPTPELGVPLAPQVLGRASSYGVLQALAGMAGLGRDLVVRTRSGGMASVSSEQDWLEHADALAGEELTVIKRVRGRRLTAVASVTQHGTIVGPALATPTADGRGWVTADLPDEQRRLGRRAAEVVGERLRREGHRGWLEVSLLAETETDTVYLDAVQTGLTPAGALANAAAVAGDELPLFAFHVLELLDADYELDVAALNASGERADAADEWTILQLEDDAGDEEPIESAPRTGVWRLEEGGPRFVRRELDWRSVADGPDAFYLRLARKGDMRVPGGELGVVVARGRLDDRRARAWADGLAVQYRAAAVGAGV